MNVLDIAILTALSLLQLQNLDSLGSFESVGVLELNPAKHSVVSHEAEAREPMSRHGSEHSSQGKAFAGDLELLLVLKVKDA